MLPWGSEPERRAANASPHGIPGALVPPRQSLADLAALLARAELVVGVDTGLTHLAAALGTPTVALFTSTDPAGAGVAIAGTHARDLGGNGDVPSLDDVRRVAGSLLRGSPAADGMRALYSLVWWLALPLLPLRLAWRGSPRARLSRAIGERFGRYATARRAGDASSGCTRCPSARRAPRRR